MNFYEENYLRGKKEALSEIAIAKERDGLSSRDAFDLCNPNTTLKSKEQFEEILSSEEEMSSLKRDAMERNVSYFAGYLSCFD